MSPTLLPVFSFFLVFNQISCDTYDESLIIKPLNDGKVSATFHFKTIWDEDVNSAVRSSHFDLFPMSLGQYIAEHGVQELHFSLTKGLWRYQRWGYPVRDSPPGAELWIWFRSDNLTPQKSWRTVSSLLSGQFCASLNLADNAVTVEPVLSFRPEGLIDQSIGLKNSTVFYAAVPHETVCTENLTPSKKLLPCFARSGLASLLSAVHLFNSNFVSLSVDVRSVCRTNTASTVCSESSIELTQTVTVVFNPTALFEGRQSWSLFKLFGSSMHRICPLASSSFLYVDASRNDSTNVFQLQPPADKIVSHSLPDSQIRRIAVYDLKAALHNNSNSKPLNIGAQYTKVHTYGEDRPPVLLISRSVTGYGVFSGGIVSHITNNSPDRITILYMDVIPWYLRIYTHSLKIRTAAGREIRPQKLYYKPAVDRVSPHHLEFSLDLAGNSVTQIELLFDRSFLKWTEYPPDANHGVYAASAVLSARLDASLNMTCSSITAPQVYHYLRIHSEPLLIYLPTPDFSMPYNVICLVSTVISLAFGPIYNLTTKKTRVLEVEDKGNESLFCKIKRFLKKEKKEEEGKDEDEKREDEASDLKSSK